MRNAIPSQGYVLTDGAVIKLGRSVNPEARAKALSIAGRKVECIYKTTVREDASWVEAKCHAVLRRHEIGREWFNVPVDLAVDTIKNAIGEVERAKRLADERGKCCGCEPAPITQKPEGLFERINIRIPPAIGAAIAKIQRERMDKPDKAVIIRELLAKALRGV